MRWLPLSQHSKYFLLWLQFRRSCSCIAGPSLRTLACRFCSLYAAQVSCGEIISSDHNFRQKESVTIPSDGFSSTVSERGMVIYAIAFTRISLTLCVSRYMLQTTCNKLADTFKRPFTAIHNRSYGILADVIECVIMRNFGYKNITVRLTYKHLKAELEDESVNKVMVIAHSQGGMILSLALDHLYTQLPAECFTKLVRAACLALRSRRSACLYEMPMKGKPHPQCRC